MAKVLICDALPSNGEEILKNAGIEVTVKTGLSEEELVKTVPEFDGVVVRSATKITRPIIEAASGKLKAVARAGAGTDNIDKDAASEHGVYVFNTPGENSNAACEQTLALLLSMLRHTAAADASMKAGRWDKKLYKGTEIKGKKVGVIGTGLIGLDVAKRLKAFEAEILVSDPYVKKETIEALGMRYVKLETLIKEADIITIHVPKNDETTNMISKEQFAQMKDGVRIVNCARGGIINEADLIEALDSGKVAGAALDVYSSEPPENWALAKHAKVTATPHLGASTVEAGLNVSRAAAEYLVEALNTSNFERALNFDKISK
ncbi:MAG: hydroxyacid dehydrogenase [Candidatus Diapherotrites archaeon]